VIDETTVTWIDLGVYGHLSANTDDRAARVIEAASAGTKTE